MDLLCRKKKKHTRLCTQRIHNTYSHPCTQNQNTHLEILPAGVGVKALHGDAVLRAAGSELGAVGAVPAAGLDDDARTVELAAVHFCGQQHRPRPTYSRGRLDTRLVGAVDEKERSTSMRTNRTRHSLLRIGSSLVRKSRPCSERFGATVCHPSFTCATPPRTSSPAVAAGVKQQLPCSAMRGEALNVAEAAAGSQRSCRSR